MSQDSQGVEVEVTSTKLAEQWAALINEHGVKRGLPHVREAVVSLGAAHLEACDMVLRILTGGELDPGLTRKVVAFLEAGVAQGQTGPTVETPRINALQGEVAALEAQLKEKLQTGASLKDDEQQYNKLKMERFLLRERLEKLSARLQELQGEDA